MTTPGMEWRSTYRTLLSRTTSSTRFRRNWRSLTLLLILQWTQFWWLSTSTHSNQRTRIWPLGLSVTSPEGSSYRDHQFPVAVNSPLPAEEENRFREREMKYITSEASSNCPVLRGRLVIWIHITFRHSFYTCQSCHVILMFFNKAKFYLKI